MNADINNIVILTGAGISAESGLATFRGPDGLWEGHRVEDVCTPEALARNPVLVHRFYDERRARLAEVAPNAAHQALAALDAAWGGDLLIVTQNVDDLHERAGAQRLLHMHGELPYAMHPIEAALAQCDLFVSIGTSGAVYPAAGFVREARKSGARTLELNMEPSQGSYWFAEARHGPASALVPQWVAEMLG